MLNEFKLFARVNESIEYGNSIGSSYEAHPFTGLDVIEAMDEASRILMAEQANVNEFIVGSDEIMVEAVMGSNAGIEALSESILSSAISMLKKVIGKLITMVKGLLVKIKAFFAKFTGKTDKWYSLMHTKVEDSKATDVKYTMYSWNTKYLDSFGSRLESIYNSWNSAWGGLKYTELLQKTKEVFKKYNGKDISDGIKVDDIPEPKVYMDKKDETVIAHVISAMDCDGTNLSEALSSIVKKARGGTDKIEHEVSSSKGAMLAYIKGASKGISALEKCYTKMLTSLNNFNTAIDKSSDIKFEGEGAEENKVANAVRTMFGDYIKAITSYTTAYHTAINQIGRYGTSLIGDCVKEYMGAMTKVAGGKAKDDKKD